MDILSVDPQKPDGEAISRAAKAVLDGEIICYPTETVYGIGADAHSEEACRNVNRAKGRDEKHPLITLIRKEQAPEWVSDFGRIRPLVERFWPGPMTLLLDPSPVPLPDILIGDTGAVAFRAAATPLLEELLKECGGALTSTSANPAGESHVRSVGRISGWLKGFCSVALDGGELPECSASTIVDAREFPDKLLVIRGGALPVGKLWEAFPDTDVESI